MRGSTFLDRLADLQPPLPDSGIVGSSVVHDVSGPPLDNSCMVPRRSLWGWSNAGLRSIPHLTSVASVAAFLDPRSGILTSRIKCPTAGGIARCVMAGLNPIGMGDRLAGPLLEIRRQVSQVQPVRIGLWPSLSPRAAFRMHTITDGLRSQVDWLAGVSVSGSGTVLMHFRLSPS